MVEIALAAALAVALSNLKFFHLPYGGSVSLEMLPIFYIAILYGGTAGCVAGLLLGVGQLFFGAYVVHPIQLVLDYPMAFTVLGIGGFFATLISMKKNDDTFDYLRVVLVSVLVVFVGSVLRYAVHVLSGVVFFAEYAPEGSNILLYSLVYNAGYMVPNLIVAAVLLVPLVIARGALIKR